MGIENYQITYNKIIANNASIHNDQVSRVLILITEKIEFIGDFCMRADKLRYAKSYYKNCTISVNFTNTEGKNIYTDLLENNPHIEAVSSLSLQELDFIHFDVVFYVSYTEEAFLQFLHEKYEVLIYNDEFQLAVYSMSSSFLLPKDNSQPVFPFNQQLYEYVSLKPGELYITAEERTWADEWLKFKGIKQQEELFIVLDATTRQEKLLNIAVYIELLTYFLSKPNVRVLYFDEKKIGKEAFLSKYLSRDLLDKMIFAEGLSIRESLRIIASSYTSLIFGPCTGLMHCSSSIYNYYVSNGMPANELPLMIIYTGKYPPGTSANDWWGNAPLTNCLLLKLQGNEKKLFVLKDLPITERSAEDTLPCSEYTAEMLINFIDTK
jgi:ADP-heptose:LPS heptosyltransferase